MDTEWREIKGLGQKDGGSRCGTCKEKRARKYKEKVTEKVKRVEEGQRNMMDVMVANAKRRNGRYNKKIVAKETQKRVCRGRKSKKQKLKKGILKKWKRSKKMNMKY